MFPILLAVVLGLGTALQMRHNKEDLRAGTTPIELHNDFGPTGPRNPQHA